MCAKCKKIVYPTEKLNCLDKVKTGALSFFPQPAAHSATALKKSAGHWPWLGTHMGWSCNLCNNWHEMFYLIETKIEKYIYSIPF